MMILKCHQTTKHHQMPLFWKTPSNAEIDTPKFFIVTANGFFGFGDAEKESFRPRGSCSIFQ
jgi:hypothetical protein